jgi:hypothetical protein
MSGKRREPTQIPAFARSWRASELPACERDFRNGDRMALAHAIAICASASPRRALPKWAALAFVAGYSGIIHYRSDSWESIFGPARPKGQHLAALRKESQKSLEVWSEIQLRHEAGTPIDDELFEAVGKKNGIGKTVVKEYFAAAKLAIERRSADNDRETIQVRNWCENRLDAARRAIDDGKPESARKLLAAVDRRLTRFYGASVKALSK